MMDKLMDRIIVLEDENDALKKCVEELKTGCPNCGSREKDYHKTTGTLKSICCHPWHDSEGDADGR